MGRSRKSSRPSDPAKIALRRAAEREQQRLSQGDPERWGVDRPALLLPANHTISVSVDVAGRITRARRQDIFDLMRGRGKLSAEAHEAIRRLQDDVAILHQSVGGRADFSPRVDTSRSSQTFTDVRRKASLRVEAALARSGPASARLLGALCESSAALGPALDWRMLVKRETGETLPDAQAAILRGACENLAGAYAVIDRGRTGPGAAPTAG